MRPWQAGRESAAVYAGNQRHVCHRWLDGRALRRMTAAVGLPTLRLVRVRIGPWTLDGLQPGEWREVPAQL